MVILKSFGVTWKLSNTVVRTMNASQVKRNKLKGVVIWFRSWKPEIKRETWRITIANRYSE